jgi:hypothetical protein
MTDSTFNNLIKKLTSGIPATFLKDLDMTWNMPNLLLNSNNMLIVSLAKTTTIPILSNTTDIYNSLNIQPVDEIENINSQCNLLHLLVQKYCVQQFTIGSLTHEIIDNMINDFDEVNDSQAINAFMSYISNIVPDLQKGGSSNLKTIINLIFVLILLLSTISTGTNVENSYDLSIVKQSNIVNMGTLELDDDHFKKAVLDRDFSRSTPVNIGMVMTVYDKEMQKQKATIMGQIISLISTIPNANEKLNEYINNFNERSRIFSGDCEKQCVDLMIKSYENKVFENLRHIDDVATTEEKLRDLNDIQQQITKSAPREILGAALEAASTSVASVLTQDYGAPIALWLNLPYTIYDKLSSVSSIEKEKQETLQSIKKMELTTEEMMAFNDKLFGFSKFYCQNSFNLKLQLQEGNITVIGDKIDYVWIIKLIDTLKKNIDLQDAQISSNPLLSEEQKKVSLQILQNIYERFNILRTIVNTVSNIIVNYGAYSSLTKEVVAPTTRTLDNIQSYFDDQLNYLNNLLNTLYEKKCNIPSGERDDRCIEFQRQQLEDKMKSQKKQMYIQKIQNELTMLENVAENEQRVFDANLTKTNIEASWVAYKTQMQSYVDFGINALILGQTSVKSITREATKVVASPFSGMLEGALGSLLDLAGSYARMLLTTQGGLSLFGILILISGVTGGGWLFITFKWLGRKMIAICIGPFVFLYEVLKTGSGYIMRPVSTFVVDNEVGSQLTETGEKIIDIDNYNRFLQQQEEGEEYNPDMKYGGKRKRNRLTKKMKKNKKRTSKNKKNIMKNRKITRYRSKHALTKHK